jgi:hypothetical protein
LPTFYPEWTSATKSCVAILHCTVRRFRPRTHATHRAPGQRSKAALAPRVAMRPGTAPWRSCCGLLCERGDESSMRSRSTPRHLETISPRYSSARRT